MEKNSQPLRACVCKFFWALTEQMLFMQWFVVFVQGFLESGGLREGVM